MSRHAWPVPAPALIASLALAIVGGTLASRLHAQTFGFGRAPTAQELRARDRSIPPDGAGLPPGRGTAREGREIYEAQCLRCHGATGREGPEDVLVGGIGSLTSDQPVKTVGSYWPYATTLWDYVRRAMPFDRPGVLTNDQIYGVVAYVLFLNEIVGEDEGLDAASLPAVRMPNRDGFVPAHEPTQLEPSR